MSGHSKWNNIKREKAKNDSANSKIYTKIGREIAVAVKLGGSDINMNNRLKMVVAKAKAANMPNDNINRSIKKASGELGNINYENMVYEGYGPNGSAIVVEALTDNKNRTAGDVRHIFDKFGGSLGSANCVLYLFTKKGVLIVAKGKGVSDELIMEHSINANAEDAIIFDDHYEVICSPENYLSVKQYFEDNKVQVEDSYLDMVASNYITLEGDKLASFNKLIDALNDNDDVQEVYHNVEL